MVEKINVFKIRYHWGESVVFLSPEREVVISTLWGEPLDISEIIYVFGNSEELRRFVSASRMAYYIVDKYNEDYNVEKFCFVPLLSKHRKFDIVIDSHRFGNTLRVPREGFETALRFFSEYYYKSIPVMFEHEIKQETMDAISNVFPGLPEEYYTMLAEYEDEI